MLVEGACRICAMNQINIRVLIGDLNGVLYLIEGLVRKPKHGIAMVGKEGLEAAEENPRAEVWWCSVDQNPF